MAKDFNGVDHIVFICNGNSCLNKGAEENTNLLRKALKDNSIDDQIHTIKTRCCGQCKSGPIAFVYPEGVWYKEIDFVASEEIVTKHLIQRQLLSEKVLFRKEKLFKRIFKKIFNKFYFCLVISFLVFFLQNSIAQQTNISGEVKDFTTQEPLIGVSVVIKEINISTLTNAKGQFELKGIAPGDYTFQVMLVGYEPHVEKVKIKNEENKQLNIILKQEVLNLAEVVVNANTTRQGESKLDLMAMRLQPIRSAQDLLRTVPGLFIAQHAGGGKAEQIFIRGNDNDHGTDFAIFWDGIPVNMPSHAHGQGYADMHFIIPELVGNASFFKGPYDSRLGDFSISGASFFSSKYKLGGNTLKAEYGMFNSHRYLMMVDVLDRKHLVKKWKDNAYVATDYSYTDGFFQNKLNFKRWNIFGKYNAQLSENTNLSFTASTFTSDWNASGQIPSRAVETGMIDRFGAIDNSEGGITSRTNVVLKSTTLLKNNSSLTNHIYYSKNIFTLFSNFTFFMLDSLNGDAIRQWEQRDLLGLRSSYTRTDSIGNTRLNSEIGITSRTDILLKGRDQVRQREFMRTPASDDIFISNYSFFVDEHWKFYPRWNLNLGLRNDLFYFRLKDKVNEENDGSKWIYRFSPKLNLYYDVSSNVTCFVKSGIGFHTNPIQSVLNREATSSPVPQAYGVDLGSNFKTSKRMIVSLAAWWLRMGSEFKFVADDGSFEDIGDSRKVGVDLSVNWQILNYLWTDIHLNYAKAVLIDAPANENLIPMFPAWNSTGGVTYKLNNGLNGGLRYRYMGPRPAIEDGSVIAKSYFILDVVARYTRTKFEIGLAIENIFNTRWDEAQFYDASRLRNESQPVVDFHYTPGTPLFLKGMLSYFF